MPSRRASTARQPVGKPNFFHHFYLPFGAVRTRVRVFFQKQRANQQVQLRRNWQLFAMAQQRPRLPPSRYRN